MDIFRISRFEYSGLTGEGAKLFGGRWNSAGMSAIYCSGSRSLAMLEFLAHFKFSLDPPEADISTLSFPEDLSVSEIRVSGLPPDWNTYTFKPKLQKIGDGWLKKGRTLLLKVPSVIIQQEYNYIINPKHKDFPKIRVSGKEKFRIDNRLLSVK
jgi:RES domain-containing protein